MHSVVGSGPETITWWQMVVRATVIFLFLLLLVRFGGKRIFGQNTSFDIVLGVLLGSTLSRALTANAPFVPTLAASAALVVLHGSLARFSLRSPRVARLAKGKEDLLIEDGRILEENLHRTGLTEHDLMEGIRLAGSTEAVSEVKRAYLERNGNISVVRT